MQFKIRLLSRSNMTIFVSFDDGQYSFLSDDKSNSVNLGNDHDQLCKDRISTHVLCDMLLKNTKVKS